MMLAFFRKDPQYKSRFKQVWFWHDWPQRTGADTGVDIVAECHDGEICAIQCKFYDEAHELKKEDIDSFLNMLGKKFLRAASLSRQPANGASTQRKHLTIALNLVRDLISTSCNALVLIGKAYCKKTISIPLCLKKNSSRINKLPCVMSSKALRITGVGNLIMPCGTGKTLTG
ncbi:MAG: hypothetical protein OYH77_06665 [Pseudomonadota bacterium]|nr:hypothetical protein [Pseudomonadota bacterium]